MISLRHHPREFLISAAHHAKRMKIKELNSIEADLILAESLLHELQANNYPEHMIMDYGIQVQAIRKMIKERKLKII